METTDSSNSYRGRLAPSPTGLLHLGHARTFWVAQQRVLQRGGTLVLRNEDLDRARCKPEFVSAMFEDLRWFGFDWQEGPDRGGPVGPYSQSERGQFYHDAFETLRERGFLYACVCSRQDVLRALQAPHTGEDEPIYPGTCRTQPASQSPQSIVKSGARRSGHEGNREHDAGSGEPASRRTRGAPRVNWRFRVPDGEEVCFVDGRTGPHRFVAGKDFGDFVVWRHDDVPAYQLAVVVDDAAMRISEVVRGEDLLRSTARQLLLYRALSLTPPAFYHCPLLTDEGGVRLAKRHDALSLRALRAQGTQPTELRKPWDLTPG